MMAILNAAPRAAWGASDDTIIPASTDTNQNPKPQGIVKKIFILASCDVVFVNFDLHPMISSLATKTGT